MLYKWKNLVERERGEGGIHVRFQGGERKHHLEQYKSGAKVIYFFIIYSHLWTVDYNFHIILFSVFQII